MQKYSARDSIHAEGADASIQRSSKKFQGLLLYLWEGTQKRGRWPHKKTSGFPPRKPHRNRINPLSSQESTSPRQGGRLLKLRASNRAGAATLGAVGCNAHFYPILKFGRLGDKDTDGGRQCPLYPVHLRKLVQVQPRGGSKGSNLCGTCRLLSVS